MVRKEKGKTYDVVIRCLNCGQREVWEMMWGELVAGAMVGEVCPGCGCEREVGEWEVMSEMMV